MDGRTDWVIPIQNTCVKMAPPLLNLLHLYNWCTLFVFLAYFLRQQS